MNDPLTHLRPGNAKYWGSVPPPRPPSGLAASRTPGINQEKQMLSRFRRVLFYPLRLPPG